MTWSRRAALSSSTSVIASQRSSAPLSNSSRIASAPVEPPGSRVRSAGIPLRLQGRDESIDLR